MRLPKFQFSKALLVIVVLTPMHCYVPPNLKYKLFRIWLTHLHLPLFIPSVQFDKSNYRCSFDFVLTSPYYANITSVVTTIRSYLHCTVHYMAITLAPHSNHKIHTSSFLYPHQSNHPITPSNSMLAQTNIFLSQTPQSHSQKLKFPTFWCGAWRPFPCCQVVRKILDKFLEFLHPHHSLISGFSPLCRFPLPFSYLSTQQLINPFQ